MDGEQNWGGDKNFLSVATGISFVNTIIMGIYFYFCIKKKYKTKQDTLFKTESAKNKNYKLFHILIGIVSIAVYFGLTILVIIITLVENFAAVITGYVTSWLLFIGSLFEGYRKYYSPKSENSKKSK